MDSMREMFSGGDPKDQVKKWKQSMRGEARKVDRQIREIQREEGKIKKSLKAAGKRGDTESCKLFAKEIVRSRKAVNRLETSKAQMNSVMMNVEMQVAQGAMIKRMSDTAGVMKMMNKLTKVDAVQETMQQMQMEMTKVQRAPWASRHACMHACTRTRADYLKKCLHSELTNTLVQAGIMEEMVDDAMDVLDEAEDEDAADEEVMKVLTELNADTMSAAKSAGTHEVQQEQATEEEDDEEEMAAMREKLAALKS